MPTDYDAPRTDPVSAEADTSLEVLAGQRKDSEADLVDVDDQTAEEGFVLPDAEVLGEELMMRVIPQQSDEFTCTQCFLVHHRHMLAGMAGAGPVCTECAA
jgi:Domain of unknown function (DUF4193)